MSEYCCDRMEYFVNKKLAEVDRDDYYLVWTAWKVEDDDYKAEYREKMYYCPVCGEKLGDN